MGRLTLRGHTLAAGSASGPALVLAEPLSLWGGLDPASGLITDTHHSQHGASVRGRVLVMPGGRGSSSSSSVLAEAVRAGTAPLAIVLGEADLIMAVGAEVAAELYGVRVPVVRVAPDDLARIADGTVVDVEAAPVFETKPGATVVVDA